MSYINLAKLAIHRRSEMEDRIASLVQLCDLVTYNMGRLKDHAQSFVDQLNLEEELNPSIFKGQFLRCMQQLDEYIYLMTDFNLTLNEFDFPEQPPNPQPETNLIPDNEPKGLVKTVTPVNLFDALSDSAPSTSSSYRPPENHVVKKSIKKLQKKDVLIDLSSASCSQESVQHMSPHKNDSPPQTGNTRSNVQDNQLAVPMENLKIEEPKSPQLFEIMPLPSQPVLQTDMVYKNAIIISASDYTVYIVENVQDFASLLNEMSAYYREHKFNLTPEQLSKLTFCSYLDENTPYHYRALFVEIIEEDDQKLGQVYLVDTGETHIGPISAFAPLAPQFCKQPPFARRCHLAGLNINEKNKEKIEEYLLTFQGKTCDVEVDDNNSEYLEVYIHLHDDKEMLNQLLVNQGLATPGNHQHHSAVVVDPPSEVIDSAVAVKPSDPEPEVSRPSHGPPSDTDEIDILECPEYEDPLLAVTGYHNRDEAEICAHYKGGPDKTCFKGTRCNKRHVKMDPDGWTLDRIQVPGKGRLVDLPAPGSWFEGPVTYVQFLDKVYIQIAHDTNEEPPHTFGVVLPPHTFKGLNKDMNSAAARAAMKPLTMSPAFGELVAALYPPDSRWYRARVVNLESSTQSVQVMFVDYGNTMWVKENNIRELDPSYLLVPFQAVLCNIAGIEIREDVSPQILAQAKKSLENMILERTVKAQVISRGFDNLEVTLYDPEKYDVAQTLVALGVADMKPVKIYDDTQLTQRVIVP